MKNITNTTCILPWIALDRNADTSDPAFAPCCLYQSQDSPQHNFEEYWNSDEFKKVRERMRNGDKPAGCWKCYNDEAHGQKSMRQSVNESRLGPHSELIDLDNNDLKPLQIKFMKKGVKFYLVLEVGATHGASHHQLHQ